MDLAGALYMFSTRVEGIESAIFLFSDPGAQTTIPLSKISSLTELGNTVGHSGARVVTLPDPLDTRYTTYEDNGEELIITLLPPIVEGWIIKRVNEKGKKSLEWILESRARHTCIVH